MSHPASVGQENLDTPRHSAETVLADAVHTATVSDPFDPGHSIGESSSSWDSGEEGFESRAGRALQYRALLCLDGANPLRRRLYALVHRREFEIVVTAAVVVNCVFLALHDPTVDEQEGWLITAEWVFVAVFSLEICIKVVACGLVMHPHSYLRSKWNCLDAAIVLLAYLASLPTFSNYSSARALRALRPLRSINRVPGLKVVVVSLFASVRGLLHVLCLVSFFFLVFSILGVQLFMGQYRRRCVDPGTGRPPSESGEGQWCQDGSTASGFLGRTCEPPLVCREWRNPDFGFVHFDNIGTALLVVFQCVTMEGWVDQMYRMQDAWAQLSPLYFIPLVVFGTFFLLNLALAVIFERFSSAKEENIQSRLLEHVLSAQNLAALGLAGGAPRLAVSSPVAAAPPAASPVPLLVMPNPLRRASPTAPHCSPPPQTTRLTVAPAAHNSLSPASGDRLPPCGSDRLPPCGSSAAGSSPCSPCLSPPSPGGAAARSRLSGGRWGLGPDQCGAGPLQELPTLQQLIMGTPQDPSKSPRPRRSVLSSRRSTNRSVPAAVASEALETATQRRSTLTLQELGGGEGAARGGLRRTASSFRVRDHHLVRGDSVVGGVQRECATAAGRSQALQREALLDRLESSGGPAPERRESLFTVSSQPPQGRGNCVRRAVQRLTDHSAFQWSVMLCILVNTALLSIEHHGQPSDLTSFLNVANYVFIGIFALEFVLRVFALGPRDYARDVLNILDGTVVVVSLVELGVSGGSFVSVFRALRLLRVFKLMKNFPSLRNLVRVIAKALAETGYLTAIIALYLVVAAQVGMQLYGGRFTPREGEAEPPRANFDSFGWSMLTVFQILTRDDWVDPMWDAMRTTSSASCLYFVALVVLGDFLFLNLFLAILISSFDRHMNGPIEEADSDSEDDPPDQGAPAAARRRSQHTPRAEVLQALLRHRASAGAQSAPGGLPTPPLSLFLSSAQHSTPGSTPGHVPLLGTAPQSHLLPGTDSLLARLGGAARAAGARAAAHAFELPRTNGGRALCLLGPESTARRCLTFLVTHRHFESAMLFAILVSSVLLAAEDPRKEGDPVTAVFNIAFSVLFMIELMLKVLAFGLVAHRGAYLRDGWNVLDAMVVCISVLSLVFSGFKIVKVFRALRALRPLRVVNRNIGLKLVVRSLLKSLPAVGNVAIVALLIFLIFGILGVQLFAGRMYRCLDPDDPLARYSVRTESQCALGRGNSSRRWVNNDQNFDNVGVSVLTLFEVSTLEQWSDIMYEAIDHTGVGTGPRRRNSPWLAAFYFCSFVVIASFFIMNLFVGVIIWSYTAEKAALDSETAAGGLLTEDQEEWRKMQRFVLTFRPSHRMLNGSETSRRAGNTLELEVISKRRRAACRVASHPRLEAVVTATIIVNVAAMAMEHRDMPAGMSSALDATGDACSAVFIAEAAVKLYAWRLEYFRDPWNRFDFFLVVLAVLGWLLLLLTAESPMDPTVLRVFRIFRLARMFRLVRSSRGTRVLLETLWHSLPFLSNIGLFLALLFFIYATLGTFLFYDIARGEYLDYHANFDHWPRALLALFRVCTGESWNGIMHDLMVTEPDCETPQSPGRCTPHPAVPPLYFVSFIVMASLVLLNLFVAIILDNFATTVLFERSAVTIADVSSFQRCWSFFDPDADMLIPTYSWIGLMHMLGPPLGVQAMASRTDLLRKARELHIVERGGTVHFVEVLVPLCRNALGVQLSAEVERQQRFEWAEQFPDLNQLPCVRYRGRTVTVDQYFAATFIAAAFRRSQVIALAHRLRRERQQRFAAWQAAQHPAAGRGLIAVRPAGSGSPEHAPSPRPPSAAQPVSDDIGASSVYSISVAGDPTVPLPRAGLSPISPRAAGDPAEADAAGARHGTAAGEAEQHDAGDPSQRVVHHHTTIITHNYYILGGPGGDPTASVKPPAAAGVVCSS